MKKPWVYNEGKVKFYGKDQNLLNKLNYEGNYLDGVTIEKKVWVVLWGWNTMKP